MVLRGLVTLRVMINKSGDKAFPLFKVSTEFQYQKVITIPHMNEIRVTMINLVKLIKESSSAFTRWKPLTCLRYRSENDGFEPEELGNYSYLRDIYDNQTIKLISVELSEIQK